MATAKRDIIANKVKILAADIMTDRSTLPHISSSVQGLMEEHTVLEFLPSLYVELLSKLTGLYAGVLQE